MKSKTKKRYRDNVSHSFHTIFSPPVHVVFSRKAFKNLLRDRGLPRSEWSSYPSQALGWVATYLSQETEGERYVVFVDGDQEATQLEQTIIHESMHVVQKIEKYTRTTFDIETEAYLLEYVVMCIKSAWAVTQEREMK